jgi:hypothetical protein
MHPDLIGASDRALDYLESSVLQPGFKEDGHDDVAYFFKAPTAFLAANRRHQAERAWTLLTPYLEAGGKHSGNQAYSSQYPMYPWYWMARAARGLGEAEALDAVRRSLAAFVHPTLHAATVRAPFTAEGANTVDFFMTAAIGQVDCLVDGDRDIAGAAAMGESLLRFIDAQAGDAGRFHLRMNDRGGIIEKPPAGEPELFYWVARGAGGQLFFMLGLPMMHLVELHRRTDREKYLNGAEQLLHFSAACGEPLSTSLMAHKVARGAAMLAAHTGNEVARDLASAIATNIAATQQPDGRFDVGSSMDSFDQTAELALWLREIAVDLES